MVTIPNLAIPQKSGYTLLGYTLLMVILLFFPTETGNTYQKIFRIHNSSFRIINWKLTWGKRTKYFHHVLYLFQIYLPLMLTYVNKKKNRPNTHYLQDEWVERVTFPEKKSDTFSPLQTPTKKKNANFPSPINFLNWCSTEYLLKSGT